MVVEERRFAVREDSKDTADSVTVRTCRPAMLKGLVHLAGAVMDAAYGVIAARCDLEAFSEKEAGLDFKKRFFLTHLKNIH